MNLEGYDNFKWKHKKRKIIRISMISNIGARENILQESVQYDHESINMPIKETDILGPDGRPKRIDMEGNSYW